MNPKTVVILLLVFAIFIALLLSPLFMTPSGGPSYDASQDVPALPEEFLSSKLTKVTLPTEEGILDLSFREGKWWINTPHKFPANTKKINEFLQRLSEVSITPPGDPSEDSIPNEPEPIYLENSNGAYLLRPIRRIGAGRTIIEIASDQIESRYNANNTLHELLDNLHTADFFASSPEPLLLPDLSRIEITSEGKTSSLQQSEGKWWIGGTDQSVPALEQGLPDAPGVSTYLELHNNLKLRSQQPYSPTDTGLAGYGLDPALISVDYLAQDGQAWRLQVGVPADPEDKTRYVSYGPAESQYPAVFVADTLNALVFGQDAKVFRDPRIMKIPRSLIGEMAIRNRTGHYKIKFMSNGVQFITSGPDFTPGVTPLNTKDGAKLARQLSDARAIEYITADLADLRPIASVIITPRLDGAPETLTIFPDTTDEAVLIQINSEMKLRKVKQDSIRMLLEKNFIESNH
ncbi:MAG: hypothetical protein AAGB26_09805 [Planctomycetota bacterium]